MNKNTDPKKLDLSNIGDAAILTHADGSSQSVTITRVGYQNCRVEWKTCINNTAFIWLTRAEWVQLTLFPAGCKFLAL